jgi:ligand-binding sensor domain-containing protein/signal transduction histidine kinase
MNAFKRPLIPFSSTVLGAGLLWHRRHLVLLLPLLLLLDVPLRAEEIAPALEQYAERKYSIEQGLPQNEVRSMVQTSDGYLWFGTRDGLARFDGVRFVTYRHDTTSAIGHDMLGAMLVDHSGILWIATGDGLTSFKNGVFTRYTEREGLPANAIHCLLEDRNGTLWVGTWRGLASFDGKRFRRYSKSDGFADNAVSGFAEDGAGGLWIGTFGGGLLRETKGQFKSFADDGHIPSRVIENLLRDHQGRLWIGTLQGSAVLQPDGSLETIAQLPGKSIFFFEDRFSSIWSATDKVFARLRKVQSKFLPEKAPLGQVESMLEDRDGSLWIGTHDDGAIRYRTGVAVTYATGDSERADNPSTILEDSRQRIWIGGPGGLKRWDNGEFHAVPIADYPAVGVQSLAEDDQGLIWVGTPRGVAIFDGTHWLPSSTLRDLSADIHVIYRVHMGRMWLGSPTGLTIWDHGMTRKLSRTGGLPGDYVMSLLEDQQHRIWVGTITGLGLIEGNSVTSFTTAEGLTSDYIEGLLEDAEGALWITTPSGLNRLRNGRVFAYGTGSGIPSGALLGMLRDDRNNFWICSYHGIFRAAKKDLDAVAEGSLRSVEVATFDNADGMKSNVCSGLGVQPAGLKSHDGAIWFPIEHGVVRIDPFKRQTEGPLLHTLVESVYADDHPITNSLISPSVRRIDFIFTAPTSVAPESLQFRYKLEGFENQWHDIGTQRRISFTSLPTGFHQFVVSSRRRGEDWGAATGSSTFSFTILPPWYETWWFYATSVIAVALLLWYGHLARLRKIEAHVRTTMAERTRVAQEIHDTLLQSAAGTAMQIRAGLQLLHKGSAQSGITQLSIALEHLGKSMSDARQAIWALRSPELEKMSLYDALVAAAQRICEGGPHLVTTMGGTARFLGEPYEGHLYRIGLEAITNAVRHSAGTSVDLELRYANNFVSLSVKDNGRGFDSSLFATRSAHHWGVVGMQERAGKCGGILTIVSAPGEGTQIHVKVNLGPEQ